MDSFFSNCLTGRWISLPVRRLMWSVPIFSWIHRKSTRCVPCPAYRLVDDPSGTDQFISILKEKFTACFFINYLYDSIK